MTERSWIDPRDQPVPPNTGPPRPLAETLDEVAPLLATCKEGRHYDVERWIASGGPLQLSLDAPPEARRKPTALLLAIDSGALDLALLLLCNGYRTDLERDSPLNAALERRRKDFLYLLLDWGSDPNGADVWRILDTYDREIFDRFASAGVDLASDGALAYALSENTRNRPLYGFVKNMVLIDKRYQRPLDVALSAAINEENDKAVSLCLWAGANPRARVADLNDSPEEDKDGATAIERAVEWDRAHYLKKMGFDHKIDRPEELFDHVYGPKALKLLVAASSQPDWSMVAERMLSRYLGSRLFGYSGISLEDLEETFEMGGVISSLDRDLKRRTRQVLLDESEWQAPQLFRLLRDSENLSEEAFVNLLAHEKLAERVFRWSKRDGVDRHLYELLAHGKGVPRAVKEKARAVIAPKPRIIPERTRFRDEGQERWFSREELYELVWSTPLIQLAERFGISDNAIRKRCKSMLVPTPHRGYWQRRGKGARRQALPRLPAQ